MEKTQQQIRDEVIGTFNASIKETQDANLARYVVAITDDGTPLRESGTGTIAIYGAVIFNTDNERIAKRVAREFNVQLSRKGSDTRVAVEPSITWRKRRIDAVLGYIALIVNGAKEVA